MSGQDQVINIQDLYKILDKCILDLAGKGRAKAQAECDYRVELAEKILTERAKKIPVTIISDICRGDRKIAKLKFDRDVADVLYDTVLQKIYATKLQLQIAEKRFNIEYSNTR